jgi:hypothetical protein
MVLASTVILCLGPYRYPAEQQALAGAGREADVPATKHA